MKIPTAVEAVGICVCLILIHIYSADFRQKPFKRSEAVGVELLNSDLHISVAVAEEVET
jgi:hypothetical protein